MAPWELAGQPLFWRNAALVAEDVEAKYREHQRKQQETEQRGRRR